jgi:hypothetical protein
VNNCRLIIPPRESKKKISSQISESQGIWKRKNNHYSLSLHAQHKNNDWYVYSGCSNRMTGDRNRFVTLKKEKHGSASFGNNHSSKIIGRGTINFGIKYGMA